MTVLELTRVDKLTRTYTLATLFPTLTGFSTAGVALLPRRVNPVGGTVFTALTISGGNVTVTYAGPDASSAGAVVVTAPSDAHIEVTTTDGQVATAKAETLLLSGGGTITPLPTTYVTSVVGQSGVVSGGQIAADPAVKAAYGARFRDLSQIPTPSTGFRILNGIVKTGTAGAFDAGYVEGPSVFFNPESGQLGMVYTGYNKATNDPTTVSCLGLAYSDDGLTWTKSGQLLAGTGTAGDPDQIGLTGGVMVYDAGTYHLFYIGLTAAGYEGGTKRICHATASSLAGPWTRLGAVISPSGSGWRQTAIWHPNLTYANGTWYLFFNATGADSKERCGYATASSLNGPWTVDDANSPLLPTAGHTTDNIWGGDPFVWREGDHWRMDFSRADSANTNLGDWWATTTDALFPLGWTVHSQLTDASNTAAPFKPWIIRFNGQVFHYGTNNGVSVAVGPDALTRNSVVPGAWQFAAKSTGDFTSSLVVGDDLAAGTGGGSQAKLTVGSGGSATTAAMVIVGQDASHAVLLNWITNRASPGSATASLETYGANNPLWLQNNAGSLIVSGSGGKLAFYGGTPATKPALTYSRSGVGETAAVAALRAALAGLGLITDSTTA